MVSKLEKLPGVVRIWGSAVKRTLSESGKVLEQSETLVKAKHQHSVVKSAINGLEVHGVDRYRKESEKKIDAERTMSEGKPKIEYSKRYPEAIVRRVFLIMKKRGVRKSVIQVINRMFIL